ncbi:hypothetical protein DE146DRAFT_628006 [Phaeosphaeria sp. MPI-PUGE-AT-0046c]|nr:hypothetical protein DE146DRAFT_628006 [Phaeosphaeria sp. MPI-PUGE-AT-0046c]
MASSARRSRCSGTDAGSYAPNTIIDDIDALVGEYLAWQTETEARERSRRGSAGTLVIDWDGSEYGHAFYRGRITPLSEGSSTVSSSATSRATSSTESRKLSSATSRTPCSTATRTTPTYAASTVPSSAKAKQSKQTKARSRRDSVFSTHHQGYDEWEHLRLKVPSRRDSTKVNFHRNDDHQSGGYGHANISVAYSPTSNTARGHDPATQLNYAYNGQTTHVHERQRQRSRATSTPHTPLLNAYFSVPVEQYRTNPNSNSTASSSSCVNISHLPHQHKPLFQLPAHKQRTAKSFIKRVLSRLDSSGVLGKIRKEREESRKSKAWIGNGYVT